MSQETYSTTMVAAETLSGDGWNVWVDPGEDRVLATKDGLTMEAEISQHGRDAEDLIERFLNEDDNRTRIERVCWACLRDGYTGEEIEAVIDRLCTDEAVGMEGDEDGN